MASLAAASTVAALAFVGGMESQRLELWPAQTWKRVRNHLGPALPPPDRVRSEVSCPADALVVLVLGQSHGANSVNERFVGKPGVVEAYRGKCYKARDPLLGAEGDKGNLWTIVGNLIVERQLARSVILIAPSIGSSRVAQWAPGGSLHRYLDDVLASVPGGMKIDRVALQIGEGDYLAETGETDFRNSLDELLAYLRNRKGITAQVLLARESLYCSPRRETNPVAKVQRTFRAPGVLAGPNMDALPYDRYDGCHLSGRGARLYAEEWVEKLFPNA